MLNWQDNTYTIHFSISCHCVWDQTKDYGHACLLLSLFITHAYCPHVFSFLSSPFKVSKLVQGSFMRSQVISKICLSFSYIYACTCTYIYHIYSNLSKSQKPSNLFCLLLAKVSKQVKGVRNKESPGYVFGSKGNEFKFLKARTLGLSLVRGWLLGSSILARTHHPYTLTVRTQTISKLVYPLSFLNFNLSL